MHKTCVHGVSTTHLQKEQWVPRNIKLTSARVRVRVLLWSMVHVQCQPIGNEASCIYFYGLAYSSGNIADSEISHNLFTGRLGKLI